MRVADPSVPYVTSGGVSLRTRKQSQAGTHVKCVVSCVPGFVRRASEMDLPSVASPAVGYVKPVRWEDHE